MRFQDKYFIDKGLPVPGYLQLVQVVQNAVRENMLKNGDDMPSINELSAHYKVSRETIEKGYKDLKDKGILGSVRGKGFFVTQKQDEQLKILLLFDKLSSYKRIIYDSLIRSLGTNTCVDFYVYNSDPELFTQYLEDKKYENYSHYVIAPHFIGNASTAKCMIESLPKKKLILLNNLVEEISGDYGAVYENYEKDIFNGLTKLKLQLQKYQTLTLVTPDSGVLPTGIATGFIGFCSKYQFNYQIVNDLRNISINSGNAYVVVQDEQLAILLEKLIPLRLIPGTDIGILSYNETPVKKMILNGLTTISTDFKAIGSTAAQMIMNRSTARVQNPFFLTLRSSV